MTTRTLHDYAAEQLAETFVEYGAPSDSQDLAIDRWIRHLINTSQVPDDILETLPEVSRHNAPQRSPQQYACGCVTVTHITDRDYRRNEKPFEMRLVLPCKRAGARGCALKHVRRNTVASDSLEGNVP